MVSLLVTAIGYRVIQSRDAADAYRRLARVGFLSVLALMSRSAVVRLIEREMTQCRPLAFGDEEWRHVEAALVRAGYLSWFGLTVGRRSVGRRSGGWV